MASFRSLYKKGMTRTTFEERIENAKLRQRNIRKKLLAKARSLISNRGNNTSTDETRHFFQEQKYSLSYI